MPSHPTKHGSHTRQTTRKKAKRVKVPKRLRKRVSAKISKISKEGKPRKQAIAQGISQVVRGSRRKR